MAPTPSDAVIGILPTPAGGHAGCHAHACVGMQSATRPGAALFVWSGTHRVRSHAHASVGMAPGMVPGAASLPELPPLPTGHPAAKVAIRRAPSPHQPLQQSVLRVAVALVLAEAFGEGDAGLPA